MNEKKDKKELGKNLMMGSGAAALAWVVSYLTTTSTFFCVLLSDNGNSSSCFADNNTVDLGMGLAQLAVYILPFVAVGLLVVGLIIYAIGQGEK